MTVCSHWITRLIVHQVGELPRSEENVSNENRWPLLLQVLIETKKCRGDGEMTISPDQCIERLVNVHLKSAVISTIRSQWSTNQSSKILSGDDLLCEGDVPLPRKLEENCSIVRDSFI